MVSVAARAPVAVGASLTVVMQLPPGATCAGSVPQVFVCVKSPGAGLIAIAVTVSGPVPVLLSVTVAVLLSLRVTLPIAKGDGATPAVGFVPVPVSETV